MENASSNSPAVLPPAEINLLSPKDWPELAPLSLRLVIMSRSRPRAITSHRLFPTATLVVPESELADYAPVPLEKVTIPDEVTGVRRVERAAEEAEPHGREAIEISRTTRACSLSGKSRSSRSRVDCASSE